MNLKTVDTKVTPNEQEIDNPVIENIRYTKNFDPEISSRPGGRSVNGMTPTEALEDLEKENSYIDDGEDDWINWDAAMAAYNLADREDLTSSAWNSFKFSHQRPMEGVDGPEEITSEQFNKDYPADLSAGEAPIEEGRKLNSVQQEMILEEREERKKLYSRLQRGKDTYSQSAVNFVASVIGGATVVDVAVTLLLPGIGNMLIAYKGLSKFPTLLKALKRVKQIRNSAGLRSKIATSVTENLLVEGALAIPVETTTREKLGLKGYSFEEISFRLASSAVFSASLTSIAHAITSSKIWGSLFKKDPDFTLKEIERQKAFIREGVEYDPRLEDPDLSPSAREKIMRENTKTVDNTPIEKHRDNFEDSEKMLEGIIDDLSEEATYKQKNKEFDNYKKSFKKKVRDLSNCLDKG